MATSLADLKNLPVVPYGGKDPDSMQAALLERKDKIYRQAYTPRELELIQTLDDNSIVEEARSGSNPTFDRNSGAGDRDLRRYGVNVTPAQRAQMDKNRNRQRTLNYDASLNDARLEQNERNTSLRNALINVGRGIESDGSASLADSVQRQAGREASYDVAKAQASAQKTQTYAALGSAALFAFAL